MVERFIEKAEGEPEEAEVEKSEEEKEREKQARLAVLASTEAKAKVDKAEADTKAEELVARKAEAKAKTKLAEMGFLSMAEFEREKKRLAEEKERWEANSTTREAERSEWEIRKQTETNTEAELLRATRFTLTGVINTGREAINDYADFTRRVGDLNELRGQSVSKLSLIAESVFGMLIEIAEAMDKSARDFGGRFTCDRWSVMIANTFFYRFIVSLAGKEIEVVQYGKLRPDQDPEKVLCIDSLADWLRERRADALENAGISQAIALLSRGIEAPDDTSQRLALQTTEPKGEFDESEEQEGEDTEENNEKGGNKNG